VATSVTYCADCAIVNDPDTDNRMDADVRKELFYGRDRVGAAEGQLSRTTSGDKVKRAARVRTGLDDAEPSTSRGSGEASPLSALTLARAWSCVSRHPLLLQKPRSFQIPLLSN
jgi:hypothetical protein